MKSLTVFLQKVLEESGTWCDISTVRDQKTIADRVEGEGVSFLTITLPNFGKEFERALDRGYVDSNSWPGFRRAHKSCLPAFMQGFTNRIFDTSTGRLLDIPDFLAIKLVRQCSYLFAKIGIECNAQRTKDALRAYIECEKELIGLDAAFSLSLDLIDGLDEQTGSTGLTQVKSAMTLPPHDVKGPERVKSFLDLVLFFGVSCSVRLKNLYLTERSGLDMDRGPLLINFTETQSLLNVSGPIGLRTATFLTEGTLSLIGGILTLRMSSSSNLVPRDL